MAKRVIDIPQPLEDALKTASLRTGESETEIIQHAIERYLDGADEEPATITDPAEVLRVRRSAAGMWKDRTDLPDLRELRAASGRVPAAVPGELGDSVRRAATARGMTEQELVTRAVEAYVHEYGVEPAEVTDPREVEEILASTAGMWKDRTDLPDPRELRAEWERRFDRVFPDHE
jgi:hypothetical protein